MMVFLIAMMAALVPIGFLWPKTDAFLILVLTGFMIAYANKPESTNGSATEAQLIPLASHPQPGRLPVVHHP